MPFGKYDRLSGKRRRKKTDALSTKKPLVLIVDDDPGIRESLEFMLQKKYGIRLCANGEEALKQLDEEFSVAVLDIKMPGKNGLEVYEEMKAAFPNLPIIFYSAYQDILEGVKLNLKYKPFGHIDKNSDNDIQELLDTLERAVKHYTQQTLSQEVDLARLLEKIIRIVIENAGATTGVLVGCDNGSLLIQAKGDVTQKEIQTMQGTPITESQDIPLSVADYVAKTRTPVILNDASHDDTYADDTYIRTKQPKSLLCLPIVHRGRLTGLLYLENNLTAGAFTPDRLELLKMLSSQAAISIENAGLYANLEENVRERTTELTQANEEIVRLNEKLRTELIRAEKMANLGHLIAGIAHEINTPLGAIRASVDNVSDALVETLEQLPGLFQSLPEDLQKVFLSLVGRSMRRETGLTAREERKLKRKLIRMLEEQDVDDADDIADTLTDMGVYNDIDTFLPIFRIAENQLALQTAYNLSSLQRSIQNIAVATDRAAKVVSALKNYARYDESGDRVESDLTKGIEMVLTLYQNQLKRGVEVIRNYEELPPILCYPDELNQVWTNLIHNAIQAMDNKGTLRIDIRREEDWAVVMFTDSGKGVPDEVRERIFEPFFTTKPAGEGSGLGLDIVRKIVEKHKGQIRVESEPGRTRFSVFLSVDRF
ncbi:ATP-binding protein [Desulfobacterales bacterium HSG2]|nr:ATP-binding protein [Desulfobacterales bacterium HSG2]